MCHCYDCICRILVLVCEREVHAAEVFLILISPSHALQLVWLAARTHHKGLTVRSALDLLENFYREGLEETRYVIQINKK